MSSTQRWTHAIRATQAQIREARLKIAALNECIRILKKKMKAGEPWPPSTISEPTNYNVILDMGGKAPETFSWEVAIRGIRAKIRETRAQIKGRREYIASCRMKRNRLDRWPAFAPLPMTPGMMTAIIGGIHLIPLPKTLGTIIIEMRQRA